ncbi:MAG: GH92 family glycosyl hydrolase [Terriglobia bacterium]
MRLHLQSRSDLVPGERRTAYKQILLGRLDEKLPPLRATITLFFLVVLTLFLILPSLNAQPRTHSGNAHAELDVDLTAFVDPFVGTDGTSGWTIGCTVPGVTLPFGMVQWSPDTTAVGIPESERAGTYIYRDNAISGFSLNHLSGVGCPVMADVPIMPVVGAITSSPSARAVDYAARFSHAREHASPGFYAVSLDNGVKVELTTTTRAGIGRFTFPASPDSTFLFDVGRNSGEVSDATIEIIGNRKVSGSVSSGKFCGGPNKYKVYFVAEFSRPFAKFGTWKDSLVSQSQRSERGHRTGGFVGFDTTKSRMVGLKIALSYVSIENAWKNLSREIAGRHFDAVRRASHETWNKELGLIKVSGGTDEMMRVFYTALYHAVLHPNVFSDVNGEFIGFDDKVHLARGYTQYANFSSWDIYRGQVQLLALLHPKESSEMIRSLLADEQQGGGLPVWPVANHDSCMMQGDPACPIIASVYAFGARDFDAQAALKAMVRGATHPEVRTKICPDSGSFENYLKRGYLSPDDPGANPRFFPHSGPSDTLEYATADFSIAQLARMLGDTNTYRTFMTRAQFWRNTFNPKTGYIEPRRRDGSFLTVDPAAPDFYVEGNGAQYTWMIPYNLRSLFDMMGGNEAAVHRLDRFFTELNAGFNRPYLWLGNQPGFGVPWAYAFAGAPWRTQAVVRRIVTELFSSKPDGLPGTEDLGAMSAWYVFSALGFYPVIPGVGGLCLNSPLFPEATIHLGNGRVVKILGENASPTNPYVRNFTLDEKPYESTWLSYEALAKGATLRFKLDAVPNQAWGSKPEDAPPSFSEGLEAVTQ